MTAMADAAVLERDAEKRAEMYLEIQRLHQETSPFVIMFQEIEAIAEREQASRERSGGRASTTTATGRSPRTEQ